jgi:DNA-binding CsgD family transcriptional regulator
MKGGVMSEQPSKREEALYYIREGASVEETALELSVSPVTVRKWLRASGMEPPGRAKIIDKMDPAELEAFAVDWQDPETSLREIADKYHISSNTAYSIAHELQLPSRRVSKANLEGRELRDKAVAELYDAGEPYWKITETTGVAPAQITTIARKMGCKMRRPRG